VWIVLFITVVYLLGRKQRIEELNQETMQTAARQSRCGRQPAADKELQEDADRPAAGHDGGDGR